MRCQPANGPGLSMARKCRGLGFVALSSMLLAGCFSENDAERSAVRDARDIPPARDLVDRSRKGDRLVAATSRRTETPSRKQAQNPGISGSHAPLAGFYRALGDLKTGLRSEPVTVLHLGDSHIAADRLSGDLRNLFQARFGDAGRGTMMPGYPFPYYKARGVSFAKSGHWKAANSFKGDPGPYGLSGVRLTAQKKDASLSLDISDGAAEWAEATFAKHPDGGDVTVSFGGAKRTLSTRGASGETAHVRIESKGRKLVLTTLGNDPVSVLSWTVGQNRPGLRYVNFGIPGATADTPRRWNKALVTEGLSRIKPDLIVLGYGTNEGFNDALDVAGYKTRVTQLLGQLRDGAPHASVLVMGPPDSARLPRFARKAAKKTPPGCVSLSVGDIENYTQLKSAKSSKLAQWHAPPSLDRVRGVLKTVAADANAYFWDWSKVMGGPCGIHEWANAEPPLAASDHVHLRVRGAKRSAQVLFSEIMKGFEAHVRLASR